MKSLKPQFLVIFHKWADLFFINLNKSTDKILASNDDSELKTQQYLKLIFLYSSNLESMIDNGSSTEFCASFSYKFHDFLSYFINNLISTQKPIHRFIYFYEFFREEIKELVQKMLSEEQGEKLSYLIRQRTHVQFRINCFIFAH